MTPSFDGDGVHLVLDKFKGLFQTRLPITRKLLCLRCPENMDRGHRLSCIHSFLLIVVQRFFKKVLSNLQCSLFKHSGCSLVRTQRQCKQQFKTWVTESDVQERTWRSSRPVRSLSSSDTALALAPRRSKQHCKAPRQTARRFVTLAQTETGSKDDIWLLRQFLASARAC